MILRCIAVSVSVTAHANAQIQLLTIDKVNEPTSLALFSSLASDTGTTAGATLPGVIPSNRQSYDLSMSGDGTLYVLPGGPGGSDTIYAVDIATGSMVDKLQLGLGNGLEGIAVAPDGSLYISQEIAGGRIYRYDPLTTSLDLVVEGAFEIDNLVFDDQGNLIGDDINQSGRIYHIPLTGAQPILLATLAATPEVDDMAFSASEQAIFFASRDEVTDRDLFRLDWSAGMPVGDVYFVKHIGPSMYGGIAIIPTPGVPIAIGYCAILTARRKR